MSKRTVKLDKKDYHRVLLTDTFPGDVPVIFSNDGFYINCRSRLLNGKETRNKVFDSIFGKIFVGNSQSSPYKYSIAKNFHSQRFLSLMHPRAQLNFADFFRGNADLIIYHCSASPASIRAPEKVANSFYSKNENSNYDYKSFDIETINSEINRKHASSYFSYRGYNRLHKIFNSDQFMALEKKFKTFWMIDVANCFDSVYTHTISWAVKGKMEAKKNVGYENQFCSKFDRLMQRSNNNETNGIAIGPEVSRVFAEIIFQDADVKIIKRLNDAYGLSYGVDYVFFRYVDDFLVFSSSDSICSSVSGCVSDVLSEYNLYLNDGKFERLSRPFETKRSAVISDLKRKISAFDERFFFKLGSGSFLYPKKIIKKEAVQKHFISQVKEVVRSSGGDYQSVSSYLVSAIHNRVGSLVEGFSTVDDGERLVYRDTIEVLVKLMLFFYLVAPEVSSSAKVSKTILILDDFFSSSLPEFSDHFRTYVMLDVESLNFFSENNSVRASYVPLENLNILVSTAGFGSSRLLSEEKLLDILRGGEGTYFVIISILYYIKSNDGYSILKGEILNRIRFIMSDIGEINKNSECAHLFLDIMSCPYVSENFRLSMIDEYMASFDNSLTLTLDEKVSALRSLRAVYWFVKWDGLDLIKLLERKELKKMY